MSMTGKKLMKALIAMAVIVSMLTMTVFGATTAKATNKVRFRTAVINEISLKDNATVKVIRGSETLDGFEGMRLDAGDRIVTTGDAKVYILVDQNKIVRLDKDTEVELTNTLLGTKVKMTLIKGSMFFNVVEKLPEDESLQFVYGNITISVRGTSALMKGADGEFGILMTDGTVEATETLSNGEQVSSPVGAGQKFEHAEGNEANGTKSASKVSSFTLSELPDSVIEEMKKDENLMNRIVDNVPLSNGPSGPVYATPETVNLETVNQNNVMGDVMESSREIRETAQASRGETPQEKEEETNASQASAASEPVTDNNTENNGDVNSNIGNNDGGGTISGGSNNDVPKPIDTEDTVTCPICGLGFSEEEYADHVLPCGNHCKTGSSGDEHTNKAACGTHYLCEGGEHGMLDCGSHYACESGSHVKLDCGTHYACTIAEEEHIFHTYFAQGTTDTYCKNSSAWVYCSCCQTFTKADCYNETAHALLPCGHHACEEGHELADCITHCVCQGEDHQLLDCNNYACAEGHGLADCGKHCICESGTHELLPCGHCTAETGHQLAGCGIHCTCESGTHSLLPCGSYACEEGHEPADCGVHCTCQGGDHQLLDCNNYACAEGHGPAECGKHCTCGTGAHAMLPCGHCTAETGHQLAGCGKHCTCQSGTHVQLPCGHCVAEEGHEMASCNVHCICQGEDHQQLDCEHSACEEQHGLAECGVHCICRVGSHNALPCGHYACNKAYTSHQQIGDCGHYACSDVPDWYHTSISNGCGHGNCKNVEHWREHFEVMKYQEGGTNQLTYMCCIGTSDYFLCPLCGNRVQKGAFLAGTSGHMDYDQTNQRMKCTYAVSGEMGTYFQSTNAFKNIFMKIFSEEQVAWILAHLGITLTPDPS